MIKNIFFFLIIFFLFQKVNAHQPVLNETDPLSFEEPYVIEKPEISKAIYSTLNGSPHIYKISSDIPFKFYVGITVPKIDGCESFKKYSFQILDKDKKIIEEFDGESFKWWDWYEKYGKKWYWVGPETGEDFKSNETYQPGDYFIKVYSTDNIGNYVLATGDIEKFGPVVIAKMTLVLPKINKKFWGSGCDN